MKLPSRLTTTGILLACIAVMEIVLVWLSWATGDAFEMIVISLVVPAALILILCFAGAFTVLVHGVIWPRGVSDRDVRGKEIRIRETWNMPTRFKFTREQDVAYKKWLRMQPVLWTVLLWVVPWFIPLLILVLQMSTEIVPEPVFLWSLLLSCLVAVEFSVYSVRGALLREKSRFYPVIRRCASCGYDLSGLKAEEDGCTVCPECGAAWRLDENG